MLIKFSTIRRTIVFIAILYVLFVIYNQTISYYILAATSPPGLSKARHMKFANSTVYYKFIHLPDDVKCAENSTRLIAIVLSSPNNSEVRNMIRRTWANKSESDAVKKSQVAIYFILSQPKRTQWKKLNEEIKAHNDLIVTDLEESYDNLVYKVYASMDYFRAWCPHVKYLLKVDDDVAVIFDRMLFFLQKDALLAEKSISCKVWSKSKPRRDKQSKWYVPMSVWSRQYFPQYCNGPIYLIGREAVNSIINFATNFTAFQIEDVYYTGMIADAAGVPRNNWNLHLLSEDPVITIEKRRNSPSSTLSSKVFFKRRPHCEQGVPQWVAVHSFKGPDKMLKGYRMLKQIKCPP